MSAVYDIFVSHASVDSPHVRPLVDALKRAGLSIWFDEIDIKDFSSISKSISDGLANSKAFLGYYSFSYPLRRACQWELTAALVAAEQAGGGQRRILLVNPESSFEHILPLELRDKRLKLLSRHSDKIAVDAVARSIRDHVLRLAGSLGEVHGFSAPQWFGTRGTGSIRFVGRLREFWDIHSKLHNNDFALITGAAAAGSGVAQVTGLGGIGKSLLAEEYALRFGSAYPGGVFWVRAYGNDDAKGRMSVADRSFERDRQLRHFVESVGLSVAEKSQDEIEGALASKIAQNARACLWIVDDLPSGLENPELRRWLAPHPLAKTLITTRSREYQAIAHLDLGVLPQEEAYELLTFRRQPHGAAELNEARSLICDLGSHALAVDIAGAGLAALRDIQTFADFRRQLQRADRDVLELSAALADALPNGHERSIAATLLHSIRVLSATGRDFLRLASVLAVAPIRPQLVVKIFQRADHLTDDEANECTARALQAVENLSLLERVPGEQEDGLCRVHTLVTRALRTDDASPGLGKLVHRWNARKRIHALRSATIQVLSTELTPGERTFGVCTVDHDVPHARELASKITDLPEPDLLRSVAEHDYVRGAFKSAASLDERAYEIYRRRYGPDHEDTLFALSALLRDLLTQGDARVCTMIEDALEMHLRVLGEDHESTLHLLATFESLLELTGDFEQSEILSKTLVEAHRTQVGQDHRVTLHAMHNQAINKWRMGKANEAAEILQRVLTISVPKLGQDDVLTLRAQHNLGQVFATLGELQKARQLLAETLERHQRVLGLEYPDTSVAAYQLYSVLLKLSEQEEANRVRGQYFAWLIDRNVEDLDLFQMSIRLALMDGSDITGTLSDSVGSVRLSNPGQSRKLASDSFDQHQKEYSPALELNRTAGIGEYLSPFHNWHLLLLLCYRPDDVCVKLARLSKLWMPIAAVAVLLSTMPVIASMSLPVYLHKSSVDIHSWIISVGCGCLSGLLLGVIAGRGFRRKITACLPLTAGNSLAFGLLFNQVSSDLINMLISMIGLSILGFALCAGFAVADRNEMRLLRLGVLFFFCPLSAIVVGIGFTLGKIALPQIHGGAPIGIVAGTLTFIAINLGFFRLYYVVIHLFFVWPKVRSSHYKWHPVAWDHLCWAPLPGLDRLLLAYHKENAIAAEREIDRLLYSDSGQVLAALRAKVVLSGQFAAHF